MRNVLQAACRKLRQPESSRRAAHALAAALLYALAIYAGIEGTSVYTLPELLRAPYLQMATPNSVTIVWRSREASASRVRYGTDLSNLEREAADAAVSRNHVVTLGGLRPSTRYFYEVGSSTAVMEGPSKSHYFVTAPPVAQPARFTAWVVGDSGTGGADQRAVRDEMLKFAAAETPDLLLGLGDLAYRRGNEFNFTNNFFGAYREILRHTPSWPAMGNHERKSASSASQRGEYFDAFVLPAAGEAGGLASGSEAYYSFDYANAHFVVLDTADSDLSPGAPMLAWLSADLAATTAHWLIAYFHHPPYTKGSHDSDDAEDSHGRLLLVRENVVPILEAAGTDLVMAGHSHVYERSVLVDGVHCPACDRSSDNLATLERAELAARGRILDGGDGDPAGDGAYLKGPGRRPHQGTVYVVAGHGGREVELSGEHQIMVRSEAEPGSGLLSIDGDRLTFVNVRGDGLVSDTFTIIKPTD